MVNINFYHIYIQSIFTKNPISKRNGIIFMAKVWRHFGQIVFKEEVSLAGFLFFKDFISNTHVLIHYSIIWCSFNKSVSSSNKTCSLFPSTSIRNSASYGIPKLISIITDFNVDFLSLYTIFTDPAKVIAFLHNNEAGRACKPALSTTL